MLWIREKGELQIFRKRHIAMDAEALCQSLDSMCGYQVAEVLLHNHIRKLGREDAGRMREGMPDAAMDTILAKLFESDRLSGRGIAKFTLPHDQQAAINIDMWNPCVKKTEGSGKSLLFSWWCGALGQLLGRDLEIADVSFDPKTNTARAILRNRTPLKD
jgi:hypothetical protein